MGPTASKTFHCLFSRWVALYKMVGDFWNQFLNQFLMLSQMVPFFLLSMAAYKTSRVESSDCTTVLLLPISWWLFKLPCKMVGTIWKNIEKWFRNWCQVTYHFVEGHLSRKQTVRGLFITLWASKSRLCLHSHQNFQGKKPKFSKFLFHYSGDSTNSK